MATHIVTRPEYKSKRRIGRSVPPEVAEAMRMAYEGGASLADIGKAFGRSRQAVYDIFKTRNWQLRSQRRIGPENVFYRGGAKSSGRVHDMTFLAIEQGILTQQPCEVCGEQKTVAHHDDYNKPYSVRWLCKKHHFDWHLTNTPIAQIVEFPPMPRSEICSLGGKKGCKVRWGTP